MAELLTNTGAKLWSKDDYDELWLQAFEELTGTSGKSNIRLIDEAIGKINQDLDGYYFTYENNRLYICKNEDEENIRQFPVSLIDNNGTIALSVDGTTITIDENGIVHGTTVDSAFSSTSENPIQNKVVKAKFDEVNSSVKSKGDSLLYDKDTKELKLKSNVKVISTANIKSPIVFSGEQPTEQGIGDLWFVVEEITEEAGIYDANDMLLCSWENSGIDDTCSGANSIINNYPTATRVIIPNTVTNIADGAFFKIENLKEVEIPSSVKSIGTNAFYLCDNLNSVIIDTVYKWYIGDSLDSMNTAIANSDILNPQIMATYLKGNEYFEKYLTRSDELLAGLYDADGTMLCSWEDSGIEITTNYINPNDYGASTVSPYYVITNNYPNTTKVVIPESVTSIGGYSFYNCNSLTEIIISDNVISIGNSAFNNCTNLTFIVIPESVTSIGGAAFYKCSSLTKITIPDNVTSIGNGAFDGCINLAEIKMSKNLTTINMYAFNYCTNLTSITIPENVTSIGTYAFHKCNNLISATFENTSNWYVDGTAIDSSTLSNISTAARYLRSTYASKYWTNKTEN